MYSLEDYHYELPPGLVAQVPRENRQDSRLLAVDRASRSRRHLRFSDLRWLLRADDLLVLNDTRVVQARLLGKRESGGRVEVLLLHPATDTSRCRCLVKAGKPPRADTMLLFEKGIRARVCEEVVSGRSTLEFLDNRPILEILEAVGRVPLPPYVRRNGKAPTVDDARAYQTVYAREPGAVAAPTAGLHFTEELLDAIRQRGIALTSLTLHVGLGSFQPVREKDVRKHRLQEEHFEISQETAAAVNRAKEEGRRVVAVGTTAVRALEFAACSGRVQPGKGWCDLFIYPGYRFEIVDALVTNFHLPGSSLILLVSAWAGRDLLLQAYAEAIRQRYRFYSYGDAMFIE